MKKSIYQNLTVSSESFVIIKSRQGFFEIDEFFISAFSVIEKRFYFLTDKQDELSKNVHIMLKFSDIAAICVYLKIDNYK
jgi:hypothetical protein